MAVSKPLHLQYEHLNVHITAVGYSVVQQAYNAQVAKKQGSWGWRAANWVPSAKTDVFLDLKGPGGKVQRTVLHRQSN